MIKEYIATGKTLEEASEKAKAGLKAPAKFALDVHTEVIEMPRKKIFGLFGGADAKVKAYYDDGVSEKKAKNKKQKNKKQNNNNQKKNPAQNQNKNQQPKKAAEKNEQPKAAPAQKPAEKSEAPANTEAKKDFPASVDLDYAKSYFAEIVKGLQIENAGIDASYKEGVVTIDLSCEDYGIVIGRRGETLDSIQYLMSLAMKKRSNAYVRVSINVGNYREKRNETLKHLAEKNAAYVLRTKRRYTFEPMNPYERRVIHTAIQEIDGVESRSIGSNQDRRVIIEPTGGAVRAPKRDNRGRRGGDRPKATTAAPEDYTPKADRADLPKFGKIEVNKED